MNNLLLLEGSISVNQIMVYIWLGLFVVFFIVEMATVELVSVWFCLGALTSMLLALIPEIPYWVGFIVFPAVSLLFLILLRPLSKRLLTRKVIKSNVDELEGIKGKVTQDIKEDEPGEVKINGVLWTALLKSGEKDILKGSVVKVEAIKGNKLIVSLVKENEKN